MRIAYLDCSMGISGDMALAALLDAGVDEQAIRRGIESLKLPGVQLKKQTVIKGGFRATYIRIEHPEQHAHRHLSDILKILDGADALTETQRELARQIFYAVAQAEATVHGTTLEKIHFHEVGAIDSIVDIVGAAIGFDLLGAGQIVCSRIPTGHGQVKIDHGICTVPTPGTAELLKGIPLVDVPVRAELTTPTGAAIVKTVVDRFADLPEMTIEAIGYGAGTMDVPDRANLLRIFVGTAAVSPQSDRVCILETNLDNISGEVIGYTQEKLLAAGALDVFCTSLQMKKNRPGVMLSVIARPADREKLEQILFSETQTLGIRRHWVERSKRSREQHTVDTCWGPVLGKLAWQTGGKPTFTPEFEACAQLAAHHGIPLKEVYRAAEASYLTQADTHSAPRPAKDTHTHDHDHRHDTHTHDHDHRHDTHTHDHDHRHDSHSHDHDHHE